MIAQDLDDVWSCKFCATGLIRVMLNLCCSLSGVIARARNMVADCHTDVSRALGAGCYLLIYAERLGYHLVHVVILVGRKAANEMDAFCRVSERLVLLVEFGVFGAWDGVVWIAVLAGVLTDDAGPGVLLSCQVLELSNARVGVVVREVDRACLLVQRHVERLELELRPNASKWRDKVGGQEYTSLVILNPSLRELPLRSRVYYVKNIAVQGSVAFRTYPKIVLEG